MKTATEAPFAGPTKTPAADEAVAGPAALGPGSESPSPAPPSSTRHQRPRPKITPGAPVKKTPQAEESAQKKAKRDQSARYENTTKDRLAAAAKQEVEEEAATVAEEIAVQATPPATTPLAPAPLKEPTPAAVSAPTEGLPEAAPGPNDDASGQRKKTGNHLEGRITNENGFPIRNALVRLAGLPIGERTDSNGYFRLSADATASRIEVSHPDYEGETLNLRKGSENLQLSLDLKAWEPERSKIIQGAARSTIIIDEKPGYAAPLEVYATLRKRLEANKPEGIPAGKVKFSFTVNTDGSLNGFEFRGNPNREVMDYIGTTIVTTSTWEVTQGKEPVRVYMKVVL